MVFIKPKFMQLFPSGSPDEVGMRIRIVPTGDPEPAQSFPYFEVTPDGYVDIDLNTIAGEIDGVYDIYANAVDDAGNEGASVVATGVPLDSVVPGAPAGVEIYDTPRT